MPTVQFTNNVSSSAQFINNLSPSSQLINNLPASAQFINNPSSCASPHTRTDVLGSGGDTRDRGHAYEDLDRSGKYAERKMPTFHSRNFEERGFTVGVGGPVGSGKTALTLALCRRLRDTYNIAVVTNDISTREDHEFLIKNDALPVERIQAIETGGYPHAAIREHISANISALENLQANFNCQLLFVESGGDNLAANYSRELADYIIYVIDVAGGDKIPRKGGPGITHSDLLVINKTDIAPLVSASLAVMDRDAKLMRGGGPTIFTSTKEGTGVEDVVDLILSSWKVAGSPGKPLEN